MSITQHTTLRKTGRLYLMQKLNLKSSNRKSHTVLFVTYYYYPSEVKVEECNEPSCEALIFPYGVVLFNIFSTICI